MYSPFPPFFDLEPAECDYATARSAILPVPYERTTCWRKGTVGGPRAIHQASWHVELWDGELGCEPATQGIASLPAVQTSALEPEAALAEIGKAARGHLAGGKFLASVGGEHSITAPLAAAAAEVHGEIGVVQFDAHADLRDEYEGTPYSHACVMRRVLERGLPTLAVGIRSLSKAEAQLVEKRSLPVVWGRELDRLTPAGFGRLLRVLPAKVYLTFDLDFFDPSLLPATGTPVPGGGGWWQTLALLRVLFAEKSVVAMDLVELSPAPGHHASDFVAAQLLYKCLGYALADRQPADPPR